MSAVCSSLECALSLPNDWTWEWGKAAALCPVDWEGSMPLGPPICQIHQFLTKMTCRRDLALRFLSPDQGPTYSTDRPAVAACTLDFKHSPLLFFCHWQEDGNGQTKSIQWHFHGLVNRDTGTPRISSISHITALDGILLINFSITWQSWCLPSFWTASFQLLLLLCLCLAREQGQPVQFD